MAVEAAIGTGESQTETGWACAGGIRGPGGDTCRLVTRLAFGGPSRDFCRSSPCERAIGGSISEDRFATGRKIGETRAPEDPRCLLRSDRDRRNESPGPSRVAEKGIAV